MEKQEVMATLRVLAKQYSGDRKTQVASGAFVNGVLQFGVNHLAYDIPEADIVARNNKFYAVMTHSECDLFDKIGHTKVDNNTVFVTLFPCDNCARRLINEGVTHVIAGEDRPNASYIIAAKQLFDMYHVTYEII